MISNVGGRQSIVLFADKSSGFARSLNFFLGYFEVPAWTGESIVQFSRSAATAVKSFRVCPDEVSIETHCMDFQLLKRQTKSSKFFIHHGFMGDGGMTVMPDLWKSQVALVS